LIKDLEDANSALQQSMAQLQDDYARKFSLQQAAVNAPSACQNGLLHKASFEEEEPLQGEPQERDGGTTAI
jgi:hypothetical protein